jgi:cation:H+ antiporter
MVTYLGALVAGVALAAIGGELFVRGTVGIAARARVSAGLVAATVAAFATSTPELSVGIQSAAAGRPEIALGDALGSNVFNIAVVLGIALVVDPLRATRAAVGRDWMVAVVAPVLTLLALIDGRLVRVEGVVLVVIFLGWLIATVREARAERSATSEVLAEHGGWRIAGSVIGGLVDLVLAGRFVVMAAKGIGDELGLDPFVVGATMVALGTSTPEIATVVISIRRGHSEVGLGTVLGSNVFNNLWIVGIVAIIEPVRTSVSEVLLAVATCLVALVIVVPTRDGRIPKGRGAVLLAVATLYVIGTVALGPRS